MIHLDVLDSRNWHENKRVPSIHVMSGRNRFPMGLKHIFQIWYVLLLRQPRYDLRAITIKSHASKAYWSSTKLIQPYVGANLEPGLGFSTSNVVVFCMFIDLRSEVIVRFVEIGEIVDHHCLNKNVDIEFSAHDTLL